MVSEILCFFSSTSSTAINADVDENAEIYNISDRSGKYHAGLEILYLQHVRPQKHGRQLVARVAAGLHKLGSDVVQRQRADSAEPRGLLVACRLEPRW